MSEQSIKTATPRTDEAEYVFPLGNKSQYFVDVAFARQLERELAAEKERADRAHRDLDAHKRMLIGSREALGAACQSFADAIMVPALTDEQRLELSNYCREYLERGIHGVWHELATAIAAIIKHDKYQASELASLRAQVAELQLQLDKAMEYTNHSPTCAAEWTKCDCGFAELSKAIDAAKETK